MTYSFRTNGNFIDFVHTDNTSLQVENVLKSLHNTSRCVDWSLPEDTTRITFTIDEVEFKNILITEIDFDGTVMNSQDDFETGIIAAFPGLAGSGEEGGSSYLVASVELTDAQIKNLPTLGIEVIPATGAGTQALPLFGYVVINTSAGAYDASEFASLILMAGSPNPGEGKHMSSPLLTQDALEATGISLKSIPVPLTYPFGTPESGNLEGINVSYNPGAGIPGNEAVYIKDSEGQVLNYTGGNAANTLKVWIAYVVVDL